LTVPLAVEATLPALPELVLSEELLVWLLPLDGFDALACLEPFDDEPPDEDFWVVFRARSDWLLFAPLPPPFD